MSKKKKQKEVRIATLQDLVDAATPENYELLMKDLALWLHSMMLIKAAAQDRGDIVEGCAMDWTNDGVNEITGFDIRVRKKQ